MKRSVLALDCAKVTGFAHWSEGSSAPNAGIYDVSKFKDLGKRLAALYRWTIRKTKEWEVTDICIETPLVGNGTTPGKEDQFFWLIGTYAITAMLGEQFKVNVVTIPNASMFVHWAGSINDQNGDRIPKDQRKIYSVLEAQRRGLGEFIKVKGEPNHNTADAFGVLSLRLSQLGLTPPWDFKRSPGPLFSGAHRPQGVRISKSNHVAAARLVNKVESFKAGEG